MIRVLIAEDSPTQAEELRLILESEGFEVTIARDGQDGLVLFQQSDFQLVISDVMMPVMSGYDFCRKLKEDPKGRAVPVIMLTMLNDPSDIIHGLECGADNFITKPYGPDYLIGRIKDILENKRLRDGGHLKLGVEIYLRGRRFAINSDREQILDLLVSTFDDIVRKNRELIASEAERARSYRTLSALYGIAEALNQATTGKDVAERALDGAMSLPGVRGGWILLRSPDGTVSTVASRGGAAWISGSEAVEIDCVCRRRLQSGELERTTGPLLCDTPHVAAQGGRSVHYHASVPLWAGARTFGLMNLVGAEKALTGDPDVRVLTSVGNMLGLALERAELLQSLEERVLERTAELSDEMQRRRQLEEQLLQAQKIEAIGRLAGGVAHDFNNLLTVIGGYCEVLLGQCGPESAMREDILEIRKASERATALTSQLLAFSRKQILEPRILNLNGVLAGREMMLKRMIGEDIEIVFSLAASLHLVRADPGQIDQVIMNLCVNARDAMPRGGRIEMTTSNAHLDERAAGARGLETAGEYVVLEVKDTGRGMSEEELGHLFEPFYTTKGPGKGTGLGLSTVYGVVRQSGGHIGVASKVGEGTTFTIYLPAVEGEEAQYLAEVAADANHGGRETILLAEDEDSVRDLTKRILESRGYKVLAARNGQEALQICESSTEKIDLVVSDVVMPGMSGRQMVEKLVESRPGLKLIYLSGHAEDAVIRHGVSAGETAFLQKPFSAKALAAKVREVLGAGM